MTRVSAARAPTGVGGAVAVARAEAGLLAPVVMGAAAGEGADAEVVAFAPAVAGAVAPVDFAPVFGAPSPISAIRSPTLAISPFFFSTLESVPETGAGSSSVALSDSISTRGSSRSIGSPSFLNQEPICTSVIDSPTSGTRSSTAMVSAPPRTRR